MRYYIAIDAGGNKTDTILFDQTGNVIARELRRGANAFDIGPAEASTRICGAIDTLKEAIPEGGKLSAVFGSVSAAHYYPEIERRVARHADGAPVRIDGVVASVMAPVLGKEDGVCLISGAGSYCCARVTGKHRFYIGSSGYMLDTEGSGYVLGRAALIASQREHDGRGPKTLMTKIVEKDMGETVLEHLPVIYSGGRAYIASFAHAVFEAKAMGDVEATKIFDENVAYFAEAMKTAYEYMGKPYKAALGGGIFLHYPEYVEAVKKAAPEGCELVLIDKPAVYGAALEAIWLSGHEVKEDFAERFDETFARHPVRTALW